MKEGSQNGTGFGNVGNEVSHVVDEAKELLDRFLGREFVREVENGSGDMRLEGILAIMEMHAYKVYFCFADFHFLFREHDTILVY